MYSPVVLTPTTHLEPGVSVESALNAYYQSGSLFVYGYATRYGDDLAAVYELRRLAIEAKAQHERGYVLLGGGYGYRDIGQKTYLLDTRSAHGYTLAADMNNQRLTDAQRRLLRLAGMSEQSFLDTVVGKYVGVVSLRSPNDIGTEVCILRLDNSQTLGLAIVGGTAARNDWTYYGKSANDDYGHDRLGTRVMQYHDAQYYWIADLPNNVFYLASDNDGRALVALVPPEYCGCDDAR